MKKPILYLIILMLMSSCATIMNRKTTNIEIHTLPDSAKLVFSADSVITTPVRLQVPRSYNDFNMEFIHDSIHKPVVFKSKIAPEVWGNLVFLYCSPVGFMVDIYSKKRIFSYRKDILIDLTSDPPKIKEWYPDHKGKFVLTAKIPGFNFLKLDTGSATGYYSMLSGIILGVDYYYRRRSYLSAGFGFTGAVNSDYPVLGKQIADSSGRMIPDTIEKATSFIFKINNNHDFKYASIGYGLNLSDYLYSKTITDSLGKVTASGKTTNYLALGCNVSIDFRLFQFLTFGFTYAPAFFNLSAGKYEYSHVIYLDVGIRLQLFRHRKNTMQVVRYQPSYLEQHVR